MTYTLPECYYVSTHMTTTEPQPNTAAGAIDLSALKDQDPHLLSYTMAFRSRMLTAGLSPNINDQTRNNDHKVSIEIVPNKWQLAGATPHAKPINVFFLEDLPVGVKQIADEAYRFPVAVTGISLGENDATIRFIPEDIIQNKEGQHQAQVMRDGMHAPRTKNTPTQLLASEVRISLDEGIYYTGVLQDVAYYHDEQENKGTTWTAHPLTANQIDGLRLLIKFGERIPHVSYSLSIQRDGEPPKNDSMIAGWERLTHLE